MAGGDGGHGCGGAFQRGVRQFGGVRVAGGFPGHRAQAEAQRGVEAGTADASVVEADRLAFAVFQEQLPVVGVGQRRRGHPLGGGAVQRRAVALEEEAVGNGKRRVGDGYVPR